MKRILAVSLALALMLTLTPAALADESAHLAADRADSRPIDAGPGHGKRGGKGTR